VARSAKKLRTALGIGKAKKPALVLKEGALRRRGKIAQRYNIRAARTFAEVIKTTLGPCGMDKMLIDYFGQIKISNDGATILNRIDEHFASVLHPAARMIVEVAKTQDETVGDGTTTAVILAGELLRRAEELLDQKIHPTAIISGYRKALQKAVEALKKIAIPVDPEDGETLKKVAMTSMNGNATGVILEHFAEIAVDAVKQIAEQRGNERVVDTDYIQIVKKEGKSLMETQLIRGVILDKEVAHISMPKKINNAKIALLSCPVDVARFDMGTPEIRLKSPVHAKAFLEEENRIIKQTVDRIKASGANVVFCQLSLEKRAQHFMIKEGIMAARRVKESDMEKLSRATGGTVIFDLKDLKPEYLGSAELVEERKMGGDEMIFVEECRDPRSVSVLIRGGSEKVIDEAEKIIHDALSSVASVVEFNRIVAGGGAVEMEIAKALCEYATRVEGREQLSVEAFAKAMEVVPRTLAENAGHDSIDVLAELRAAHERPDGQTMGVDGFTGKIVDMLGMGVVDPLRVKEEAIKLAAEAASTILRIDDVIASAKMRVGPPIPRETAAEKQR